MPKREMKKILFIATIVLLLSILPIKAFAQSHEFSISMSPAVFFNISPSPDEPKNYFSIKPVSFGYAFNFDIMGLSFNIGLQTGFYYNLYEEFGGIIGPSISNWFYFLRIPIGIDILLIKDLYITIQSSFVYYLEKGYTTYFQFLINGGGLYGGSGIKKMFTRFWGLRVLLNINFKFTNAPPEYGDFWRQMFLDLDIGLIFRI